MTNATTISALFVGALICSTQALASPAIELGDFTRPPAAFVQFCSDYPDQCVISGRPGAVVMDARRWAELRATNRDVNAEITPNPDPPGTDTWTLGVRYGDCDDFAVEKRRRLIGAGWPSSAVLLAAAMHPNGESHLVVVVRTADGDLVLDNLRAAISTARASGLSWRAIQSTEHPRLWRSAR